MTKIVVIIPSRGFVFAQTLDSVFSNLVGHESSIEIGWDKPIPDCFNAMILKNLGKADYIWIVEEDVVVPEGGLDKLLGLHSDIAMIDYPLLTGHGTVTRLTSGRVLWCGTGCTLVKREVFDKIGYPYFKTNVIYHEKPHGVFERHEGVQASYGGHDLHFGLEAGALGFKIKVVEGIWCKHLKMPELNKEVTNSGCHKINVLDSRPKERVLKEFRVIDSF